MALGLLSRRFPLPGILAEYTGDALYAVAAAFAAAWVWPALRGWQLALIGFGFAVAVELTQICKVPWVNDLRSNRWAALVLGQGFQWQDLAAYLAGAMGALGVDRLCFRDLSRLHRAGNNRSR
ncbi:MAG: DUF2809 domain-containing protein [Planctomycetota bacterium]